MTNDDPVDLYIAAYSDPAGAGRDWADLKRLEQDGMIELHGLVLVSRDRYGKIHVEDSTHDVRKGSLIGVVGGLVAGLIFPPSLGTNIGCARRCSTRSRSGHARRPKSTPPVTCSSASVLRVTRW